MKFQTSTLVVTCIVAHTVLIVRSNFYVEKFFRLTAQETLMYFFVYLRFLIIDIVTNERIGCFNIIHQAFITKQNYIT